MDSRISSLLPSQSGIAIGPILFVIALLAILAAAIAAGSGSFTASTTKESDETLSATIIQQADLVEMGVQRASLGSGCDATQLDFSSSNPNAYWYLVHNSNSPVSLSPSDPRCSVFSATSGGKISVPQMPMQALMPVAVLLSGGTGSVGINDARMYGYPFFSGYSGHLSGMWAPLTLSVCEKINEILAVAPAGTTPNEVAGTCSNQMTRVFDGSFGSAPWCLISHQRRGCVHDSSGVGNYYFYDLLIVNGGY